MVNQHWNNVEVLQAANSITFYCPACECYQEAVSEAVHSRLQYHRYKLQASMTDVNDGLRQLPITTNQSYGGTSPDIFDGVDDADHADDEEDEHREDSPGTLLTSGDWLTGRNDPLDFTSTYVGEVFVLAAKDNPRVRTGLEQRSRNWKSYSRWRVVKVEDVDDEHGPADSDVNESKKVPACSNLSNIFS